MSTFTPRIRIGVKAAEYELRVSRDFMMIERAEPGSPYAYMVGWTLHRFRKWLAAYEKQCFVFAEMEVKPNTWWNMNDLP